MKYANFPGPPVEAALSIFIFFFLLKLFFEKELMKAEEITTNASHTLYKNIHLKMIHSVIQYIVISQTDVTVTIYIYKGKGVPRQAEVALGVPDRLRPRIISTFGTTRVVGRQPYVPAAFTSAEIPGTHFQRLSRPQSTWFCRKEPRKKSPVTPPEIIYI